MRINILSKPKSFQIFIAIRPLRETGAAFLFFALRAEGGAPGELAPEQVVEETLDRLGAANIVIPGRFNRLASWLMRLLPRSLAVRIMGQQTRKLQTGRTAAPPV